MRDILNVALGLMHLTALLGLLVAYCRRMQLPLREWPLIIFVMLWTSLVVTGYLLTPLDGMNSLSAYVVASFLALGLVVGLHRLAFMPAEETPYTQLVYPEFIKIESPKLRQYLWWFFVGTLAVAGICHLIVCFSFYPVNADTLNYRFARIFWYVSHGSLLHPFHSVDKRLTFYPLNGLLLYVPLALYGVSAVFYALPSFFAWLTIGYTTYRFARALRAEPLLAMFAMWLVAMTPSILIEASSTNDEILTAAPLVVGLFFLWRWLTSGAGHYLFLSALGAGLCVGTKLHVFFLIPIAGLAALWFILFLWRRHESWRNWIPQFQLPVLLMSMGACAFLGPFFLVLNYISSGQFYFLKDTADQVLNTGFSPQDAFQNFLVYSASIVIAPIADLNIFQSFREREVTNVWLNSLFTPFLAPFVSNDPQYLHLKYRIQGVIIPTSVLMVEYGLWPGYAWLLWFLQGAGLKRQQFTLRPFFVILAATPALWLVIWSCVTLYMEGVPTYFAFYIMCAAPAMVLALTAAPTAKALTRHWIVLAFVMFTNTVIDGNVIYNNTFRGLWHFTEDKPWPYDWLLFPQPVIDEIRHAKKIQIPMTHGKVYYYAFMHWNPTAFYYTPFEAAPPDSETLHILSTPSETSYGFMPIKIPFKATSGITYLGHIRGVDREAIFAFGNNVNQRWPQQSDFISLHADFYPIGPGRYEIGVDKVVAGVNPADRLEFSYTLHTINGNTVYERKWSSDPSFTEELTRDPELPNYLLTVSVRSAIDHDKMVTQKFAVGGNGMWRITGPGENPDVSDDD